MCVVVETTSPARPTRPLARPFFAFPIFTPTPPTRRLRIPSSLDLPDLHRMATPTLPDPVPPPAFPLSVRAPPTVTTTNTTTAITLHLPRYNTKIILNICMYNCRTTRVSCSFTHVPWSFIDLVLRQATQSVVVGVMFGLYPTVWNCSSSRPGNSKK